MDDPSLIFRISTWVIPVLLAVTLHEAAHGYVALRFGDDTALRAGRITFNPLRHIDPFGTVILPIGLLLASNGTMTFGFAKPVPVDFMALRPLRTGIVTVAFAGPGANLLLATASAALFYVVPMLPAGVDQWVFWMLHMSILINLILFVFNLIPMPPLDGGRILVALLPPRLARPVARLERVGILIILGALFLLPLLGQSIGTNLNIFRWIVGVPAEVLRQLILTLVGLV